MSAPLMKKLDRRVMSSVPVRIHFFCFTLITVLLCYTEGYAEETVGKGSSCWYLIR